MEELANEHAASSQNFKTVVVEIIKDQSGMTRAECPSLDAAMLKMIADQAAQWRDPNFIQEKLKRLRREKDVPGLALLYESNYDDPLPIPKPITVVFEPIPLDENFQGLRDLMESTQTTTDIKRDRPPISRFRKLMYRWIVPYAMFFNSGSQALSDIFAGRFRSWAVLLHFAIILSIILFVFLRRIFDLSGWYLVPGGVVVRKARMNSIKTEIRRFTPQDSILTLTFQPPKWSATLYSEGKTLVQQCSRFECIALMAAWQNPSKAPDLALLESTFK